jgi:hypothetical protein
MREEKREQEIGRYKYRAVVREVQQVEYLIVR